MLSRQLLAQAWPAGILAIRGVKAVCGWVCLAAGGTVGRSLWVSPDGSGVVVANVVEGRAVVPNGQLRPDQGDLLPDVNPLDLATWSAALADLVLLIDQSNDPVAYFHPVQDDGGTVAWELMYRKRGQLSLQRASFLLPVREPAEALVRVIAGLRAQRIGGRA